MNRLLGTDREAHVFRAFDELEPDRVKAVVIGQDPYPHVTRATGRAFEDKAVRGAQVQIGSDWHFTFNSPDLARAG